MVLCHLPPYPIYSFSPLGTVHKPHKLAWCLYSCLFQGHHPCLFLLTKSSKDLIRRGGGQAQEASIITAETVALEMTLTAIQSSKNSKFVIFSDSPLCLTALKNYNTLDPRVNTLKILTHSFTLEKNINNFWVDSQPRLLWWKWNDRRTYETITLFWKHA